MDSGVTNDFFQCLKLNDTKVCLNYKYICYILIRRHENYCLNIQKLDREMYSLCFMD